jgi:hypothetical protein
MQVQKALKHTLLKIVTIAEINGTRFLDVISINPIISFNIFLTLYLMYLHFLNSLIYYMQSLIKLQDLLRKK